MIMDPDLKEKGGGRDGNHKNHLQRQRLDQLLNRLKGEELARQKEKVLGNGYLSFLSLRSSIFEPLRNINI